MLLENHLYQTFNHPLETPAHPHTAPHTPTELERELERERSQERANIIENKESVAEGIKDFFFLRITVKFCFFLHFLSFFNGQFLKISHSNLHYKT